ncbi:MAG: nicotinate-nucleotide adenylyltransferase [Hespellia sp.]|nr:nicotinate-nucleotide adenylyltransferase [Hespellia sp.]
MVETGVIHGRFQVFHLKHMEYVLAAKMRCRKLYIGITQPDDLYVKEGQYEHSAAYLFANPLTYLERYTMIKKAILDFGVSADEFEIVPFPVERPEYILQYAPKDAVFYMNIYDSWGEEKYELFKSLGLEVDVLWRKEEHEKGLTATDVRMAIAKGQDWQQMVPKTTYEYIVENQLDTRIRQLSY